MIVDAGAMMLLCICCYCCRINPSVQPGLALLDVGFGHHGGVQVVGREHAPAKASGNVKFESVAFKFQDTEQLRTGEIFFQNCITLLFYLFYSICPISYYQVHCVAA